MPTTPAHLPPHPNYPAHEHHLPLPRPRTGAPESIFGWPALVTALQNLFSPLPLFRFVTFLITGTAPQTTPARLAMSSTARTDPQPDTDGASPPDVVMEPVAPSNGPRLDLTALPDELISMCYSDLPAADLVSLEHVSRRLRHLVAYDSVCWKRCAQARWGSSSANAVLLPAAARHAATWKQLYAEKARSDSLNAPWVTPCKSETLAILDLIKGDAAPDGSVYWPLDAESPVPASPPKEQAVVFSSSSPCSVMSSAPPMGCLSVVLLVDGSSSVTEEDFSAMKGFARTMVGNFRMTHPDATVALVQFNQYPKVEVSLTNVCKSKLSSCIDNMEQLMGSTDIAAPIRRARQILSEEASPGERAIILLTDGQTHADELQESEREAEKASEEVCARLFTLGVGRDVDETGLGRVATASGGMHFTLRRRAAAE